MPKLDIGEEVGAKKTFVWAIDWPGWCRSGKDRDLAIEALIAARGRYAKVARRAGLELPQVEATDLRVVETTSGGGGTDFGVPSNITKADRRRTTRRTPSASPAWSRRRGSSSTEWRSGHRRSSARVLAVAVATATR